MRSSGLYTVDESTITVDDPSRVLIIDDQPDEVAPIVYLLERLGCQVGFTWNGHEAIELLRERNFDFLIIDWMMPTISGKKTLQLIQDEVFENTQRLLPYIIHSGIEGALLKVPQTDNLILIDHWNKTMSRTDLVRRVNQFLPRIK